MGAAKAWIAPGSTIAIPHPPLYMALQTKQSTDLIFKKIIGQFRLVCRRAQIFDVLFKYEKKYSMSWV
jgi:hypothetical protein